MSGSMLKPPAVTPFVECPNCHQLLEYGVKICQHCRELIEEDYAYLSAMIVMHNTQACSLANMIRSIDPFAVIAVIGSLYLYALAVYDAELCFLFHLAVLWPVMPLLAILVWFFRFGRFQIGDEEYAQAKREMKSSLKLWVAILAVQLMAEVALLR